MGIAKAWREAQQVDCRCEMGDVKYGLGMGHRAESDFGLRISDCGLRRKQRIQESESRRQEEKIKN
jgi:hypothetical protein